VKAEENTF